MTFKQHLIDIGACEEARVWAGDKTAKECWKTCDRYSWLFWWAEKESVAKEFYVKCACKIARLVIHLDESGGGMLVIKAVENWLAEPTENNRIKCYMAAYSANSAYTAFAARAAIHTASSAAFAASSAGRAAYAAYSAAFAASSAAFAAAAYSATSSAAVAAADHANVNAIIAIIRETIPQPWTEPEAINLETGDGIIIKSNLGQ